MSDFRKQQKRIAAILGEDEVPEVNRDTLRRFLDYLKKNLNFPCLLTGIEDFDWEEYYPGLCVRKPRDFTRLSPDIQNKELTKMEFKLLFHLKGESLYP